MPRYHYQALNAEGVSLEGMLRANNEREAARALERRGLAVIEVRSGEFGARERRGRLRHGDVILALQELATMLTSGVSIADAVGSQALGAHHPRAPEPRRDKRDHARHHGAPFTRTGRHTRPPAMTNALRRCT